MTLSQGKGFQWGARAYHMHFLHVCLYVCVFEFWMQFTRVCESESELIVAAFFLRGAIFVFTRFSRSDILQNRKANMWKRVENTSTHTVCHEMIGQLNTPNWSGMNFECMTSAPVCIVATQRILAICVCTSINYNPLCRSRFIARSRVCVCVCARQCKCIQCSCARSL